MAKFVWWVLQSSAFLILSLILTGCYVMKQAYHLHYDLHYNRQPVDHVISQNQGSPAIVDKLSYVKKIMNFAEKNGVFGEGAYEHVVINKEKYVSYLVYAAYPDRLQAKTHWFPFVGTVPYIGFFKEADRNEYADSLAQEGYDIYRGAAGGFSSLGWWKDPIYHQMLGRDKIGLAQLFFHELTHKTFWAPGSVLFNENLAEFVAWKLSSQFFQAQQNTKAFTEFESRMADRGIYSEWLKQKKTALKTLYADKKLSKPQLLKKKAEFFRQMNTGLPSFNSKRYSFLKTKSWNNAAMIASSLYSPDIESFKKAFQCAKVSSIGSFLKTLENKMPDEITVAKMLQQLCENTSERRARTKSY